MLSTSFGNNLSTFTVQEAFFEPCRLKRCGRHQKIQCGTTLYTYHYGMSAKSVPIPIACRLSQHKIHTSYNITADMHISYIFQRPFQLSSINTSNQIYGQEWFPSICSTISIILQSTSTAINISHLTASKGLVSMLRILIHSKPNTWSWHLTDHTDLTDLYRTDFNR